MHLLKKTISVITLGVLLSSTATSFALTNKESVLTSIDTLNTSIVASIALKEKVLSDRANELGNRYDATIKSLWFQSDEVEALTSIKKLGVPSFRQDITQAYTELKQNILQDIKATQAGLTGLRDEVALGYTDLSSAQKQSYDARVGDIQSKYATFLSGSTASIDAFTNTFSGRIIPSTELVTKMMRDNGKYILYIRDIRSGYSRIDDKKTVLLSLKNSFEKDILPKIQWGFLAFTANKKTFTDAIRKDLTSGLEKALVQERIKKQEWELRAYIEDIMSKWNEHLKKNFSQDDELIDATKDLENIITTEKTLHSHIYDTTGNIQSLDMSGSSMILGDITKIDSGIANINAVLSSLIATYGTGNTLNSLNDKLIASYNSELLVYRTDFTKLLEGKLNTALLEEKTHAQTLTLIDQEEKILRQNLETTTSVDFSQQLVSDFITKITSLAKADGGLDTLKKVQMLGYRYARVIVQKKIDDSSLVPYYGKRNSLDTALASIFISLENKSWKEALLIKFPVISAKIDTLLGTKISNKNRYTLLVVQSNILKYLEDATK